MAVESSEYDVVIVGGGVAGLTAGVYTARHDFETLILDAGGSLLRRNAHLENVPGFPAGVNSRLFLDMLADQADRAGCERREAEVERVREIDGDAGSDADGSETDTDSDGGFAVETADDEEFRTRYVIAATKNETAYLDAIEGVGFVERGKTFVDTDERGRTGVEGLYAAGRLAEKPHQTVVAAGHGAEVAVTLLEDDDRPFYHDWVAPEGYFTGRGRDVPPGCEEIDEDERRERERESLEVMREYFAEPHPEEPEQHPSVKED
jgi:thioredoxin reductase